MAVVTPAPRIGKTTGARPANSEKRLPNARFHVASEVAMGDAPAPVRKKAKRKASGLINNAG